MSARSALVRYRRILDPRTRAFFLPASVARLGAAMLGLGIVWAVHGATGSFAVAGLTSGAFAAAEGLVAPQLARLVDVHGQRVAGRWQLVGFALGTSVLAVAVLTTGAVWTMIIGAALMGAACPQVGAWSASRWRFTLADRARLPTALALEASVTETAFMIGPSLVALLSAGRWPTSGVIVGGLLVVSASAVLLGQRDSEPPPEPRGRGLLIDRRLLDRRVVVFFALHACLGFYFGGVAVCVTAAAQSFGLGGLAGLVAAAGGLCSLVVGLVYGGSGRDRPHRWMIIAASVMTGGLSVAGVTGLGSPGTVPGGSSTPAVLGLFVLTGGCVAAVVIPASVLLQHRTPTVYVQAIAWTGSASALGSAAAAPLVGQLVDVHGWPAGSLLLAASTATLALVCSLLPDRADGQHADPSTATVT